MTGSGKTTFGLRYLLNVPAVCRFVFDDRGQVAFRLGVKPCFTALDLEKALSGRWVVFQPGRMFPGRLTEAFRFFCHWAYSASCRGDGKKVFMADEIWRFCTPQHIPLELAILAQEGRAENLELFVCTQVPHKLNSSIIGQATEAVCFRLDEPLAWGAVRELGFDKERVRNLPLGAFVAVNRLNKQELTGSVF